MSICNRNQSFCRWNQEHTNLCDSCHCPDPSAVGIRAHVSYVGFLLIILLIITVFVPSWIVAISNMEKKIVGFAIVDDTNLYIPQVIMPKCCMKMQQLVGKWEGLLHTTGGALVPTKCFWYLIDFSRLIVNGTMSPKSTNQVNWWQRMRNNTLWQYQD